MIMYGGFGSSNIFRDTNEIKHLLKDRTRYQSYDKTDEYKVNLTDDKKKYLEDFDEHIKK